MSDLVRHVFSTVRVVPNPATGEFANLAAIAGSDVTGDWSIRALQNPTRVVRFCGQHATVAGQDFVARVGLMLALDSWDELGSLDLDDEATESLVTEAWLTETAERNRHVVQLSPPMPVLAESAEDALDLLFPLLFPEASPRRRTLSRRAVASTLQRQLMRVGLEPKANFDRRVRVTAAGQHHFAHTLDFVVVGDRALQTIQTWSFQIAQQDDLLRDVKAWGWTMRELREHGGTASMLGQQLQVPDDIPLEVVVAPPEDEARSSDQERYAEALEVFEEVGATITIYGSEDVVARRAADLIGRLPE